MLIDDFKSAELVSTLGTRWRGVSDTVMGGVSQVTLRPAVLDGRQCLRMTGDVSLENGGGFVQATLQLADMDSALDASSYTGIRMLVRGTGEEYGVHLRTADVMRSWQSYRTQFTAGSEWQEVLLPFSLFRPHRLSTPLDLTKLRRLGLVGIGRVFHADLAVAEVSLYG